MAKIPQFRTIAKEANTARYRQSRNSGHPLWTPLLSAMFHTQNTIDRLRVATVPKSSPILSAVLTQFTRVNGQTDGQTQTFRITDAYNYVCTEWGKLCYRWPHDAPDIYCPENCKDSLTTPTATFHKIFNGLLFRSTLWMCVKIWSR